MRIYCSSCRDVHVFPCNGSVAGYEVPVEAPPWLAITESLSRRLDAMEKEAPAIAALEGAVRFHATRLDDLLGRVNTLEKQAGPIGKLYVTDVDPALGTVTFDIEDPKDALIRDLVHCFDDRRTYPPEEYALSRKNLRDRAEKLGVKL